MTKTNYAHSSFFPKSHHNLFPTSLYTVYGNSSTLRYTPTTDMDFGTVLCSATNAVGRQEAPCLYKLIAAGKQNLFYLPLQFSVYSSVLFNVWYVLVEIIHARLGRKVCVTLFIALYDSEGERNRQHFTIHCRIAHATWDNWSLESLYSIAYIVALEK